MTSSEASPQPKIEIIVKNSNYSLGCGCGCISGAVPIDMLYSSIQEPTAPSEFASFEPYISSRVLHHLASEPFMRMLFSLEIYEWTYYRVAQRV